MVTPYHGDDDVILWRVDAFSDVETLAISRRVLEVARPLIEAQIREAIALDIHAELSVDGPTEYDEGLLAAADIALHFKASGTTS